MNKLDGLKLLAKSVVNDTECGIHSGFKPCCIFFYSFLDNLSVLVFKDNKFHNYRRLFNRVIERVRHKKFHYIPCPFCVLFSEPCEVNGCDHSKHMCQFTAEDYDYISGLTKITDLFTDLIKIDKALDTFLDEKPAYNYDLIF